MRPQVYCVKKWHDHAGILRELITFRKGIENPILIEGSERLSKKGRRRIKLAMSRLIINRPDIPYSIHFADAPFMICWWAAQMESDDPDVRRAQRIFRTMFDMEVAMGNLPKFGRKRK